MAKAKKGIKLIIAGSRDITNYAKVKPIIDKLIKENKLVVAEVFSGKAKGMDTLGEKWANENDIPVREFPALWNDLKAKGAIIKEGYYGKYNAKAGLDRNTEMGNGADAAIVIWTGDSSGSEHMIETMINLGKPVYKEIVNI
jgi:hypothetical protein